MYICKQPIINMHGLMYIAMGEKSVDRWCLWRWGRLHTNA